MLRVIDDILSFLKQNTNANEVLFVDSRGNEPLVFSSEEKSGAVKKIKELLREQKLSNVDIQEGFQNDKIEEFKVDEERKLIFVLINPDADKPIPDELKSLVFTIVKNLPPSFEWDLNRTIQHLDVVIYATRPDRFELNVLSGTVKELFGYDPEELNQKKFTLIKRIQREDFPKLRKFIRAISRGENCTIEYKIHDNNNQLKHVRHSGIPIKEGNEVIKVVGTIVDITREAKLREELKNSEEKFRLLIETANDLIFTLDKLGNFLMVNKNGALALGYGLNEMIGKHFLEFVSEESKSEVAVAFQKILSSSEPVAFEAHLIDNFGKEMIFEILARSVGEESLEGMLAIGRDVTKRRKDELKLKELNNKLIEANRIISIERDRAKEQITVLEELNKLKNDFISNVSHELRTPLASIVGFAEAISSDSEMPREMINEFNEIIYTEGKRLAKLINDILDFSKLDVEGEPLEKSEFNLLDLVRDLIKNHLKAAEDKGITFTAEIPEALIPVFADKERIANAIGNIITNAIKFTDKGGRVTIIINDFLKDVEIIISDTGIGIPKEAMPKLFEKFTKVDRPGAQVPGAGLGLAAAKKIIDLHNGLIRVKSEVNKGTTFIVRLPKKV